MSGVGSGGRLHRLRGALRHLRRANGQGRLDPIGQMLERWRQQERRWEGRSYYPMILDIAGRSALVVGAGPIGEGKIEGLLQGGANVKVVSLSATENARRWASEGRISLDLRAYRSSDLDGCFLVIAATEDNDTNVRVFDDAEKRQMLCNVVDVPRLCNFILPSIVRRGDLAIAVSTAGASPAMACRIQLAIAECYGDEYAAALKILGALRTELKARYPAPRDRKIVFERMVYSDFMDMVRAGEAERIEAWVRRCTDEGPNYTTEEEHGAMLEAAMPECKLRFKPIGIENLAR